MHTIPVCCLVQALSEEQVGMVGTVPVLCPEMLWQAQGLVSKTEIAAYASQLVAENTCAH